MTSDKAPAKDENSRNPAATPVPAAPLALRALSIAAITVAMLLRLQLRDAPIDNDQGEYAVTGQLLLRGIAPFREAANMKLPGAGAIYALMMECFGQTPAGIHSGLLLVNLASVIAVFFIGRRLFGAEAGPEAGWAAAAAYACLSAGAGISGLRALAEHFVVAFALFATLLLLRWRDSGAKSALFGSALLYGLAIVTKQGGALFWLFGLTCLLWSRRGRVTTRATLGETGLFVLGGVLPAGATVLALALAGVFPKLWFWTVTYARAYAGLISLPTGMSLFFQALGPVLGSNQGFWLLAGAGVAMVWTGSARDPRWRETALWATAFLVFSFLSLCPGLYFRPYYFLLLLPAAALLAGAGFVFTKDYMLPAHRLVLFALIVLFSCSQMLAAITQASSLRETFSRDVFTTVGAYLEAHSGPEERIAVLGSAPQAYFYARRRPAEDYLFVYGLGEDQSEALRMQQQLISQVEASLPAFIVEVNAPDFWLFVPGRCGHRGFYDPSLSCDLFSGGGDNVFAWDYATSTWPYRKGFAAKIFDWSASWIPRHYTLSGIVDLLPEGPAYQWDAAAASYTLQSSRYIRIFRRNK
jgi:hypothetical protein